MLFSCRRYNKAPWASTQHGGHLPDHTLRWGKWILLIITWYGTTLPVLYMVSLTFPYLSLKLKELLKSTFAKLGYLWLNVNLNTQLLHFWWKNNNPTVAGTRKKNFTFNKEKLYRNFTDYYLDVSFHWLSEQHYKLSAVCLLCQSVEGLIDDFRDPSAPRYRAAHVFFTDSK